MTDPRDRHILDDAELADLVRETAAGWEMPPVHLDRHAWRDRVRTPRARRFATLKGFGSRLGQAAAGAIALAVGAAVLGVWLTSPHGPAASSQSPAPRPSSVAASQLPKLLVEGEVPRPSQLVVNIDASFALVDLSTGTIGHAFGGGTWGTDVRRTPDGVLYCICLTADGYANGGYTHLTVTWNRYDAAGSVAASAPIGDYRGAPDPRDGAIPELPQHIFVHVSYGPDPNIAYIGWSFRQPPAWKSGFTLIDVTTGTVIQQVDLPDRSDGIDPERTEFDAPRVVGSAGDGRVAIARPWHTWSPAASTNAIHRFGAEALTATLGGRLGGRLGAIEAYAAADGCGDQITGSGVVSGGGTWMACVAGEASRTVIRRLSADGTVLGPDTTVAGVGDVSGGGGGEPGSGTTAVSRDGRAMFLWNPQTFVLTRVDLVTGETTTGHGQASAAANDPLAALGHWLAPSAAAKVLLSSGIAVSPDGTRVYAIGIEDGTNGHSIAGSAGVFVFDAATLAPVGHWEPTADFVSLAVSSDGQFVYVAGGPGSDPSTVSRQPASITVFDARDGSIRLIAGQLGTALMLFPSTLIR